MNSNVCFNKTAALWHRVGALLWLRCAGVTAATVAVAALALIITVGAPQAYADSPVYPGEMCLKWSGAGIPKYYYGGIGNASTTDWLYLDCPLVNDWYNHGAIEIATMTYRDLHPSADISCTLYNVINYGSNGAYIICSSGPLSSSGSSYEPFNFRFAPVPEADVWVDAVNYISCAIPPSYSGYRSYILDYDMDK
jgi:hypothetical protein